MILAIIGYNTGGNNIIAQYIAGLHSLAALAAICCVHLRSAIDFMLVQQIQ